MRKLLFVLFAALFSVPMFSQNTLTIHQKSGVQISFGFDDKPVITYTDNYIVLKTTKTNVQYPLESLLKITFNETETAVKPVVSDAKAPILSLDSYAVNIAGAKAGVKVTVYSADGKSVNSYKTSPDGDVSFSIANLTEGVYIIKSENLSIKVIKK
jgi:hypothetical protein